MIQVICKCCKKFVFIYHQEQIWLHAVHSEMWKKLTKKHRLQIGHISTLGVPTTSQIFMANSQKLNPSTLLMKPSLIFWSDNPCRRTSSAQLACSTKLSRQARQSLCVDWECPILKKNYCYLGCKCHQLAKKE